jgi:2',3'-cyclic-nucleotide 2'-phosphodiesterase
VLLIGDVIGKPGRQAVEQQLSGLRDERHLDLVVANGENLAGGMGLTSSTAAALFGAGVDVITSGNHIWDKKEIYPELDRDERILRPLNYGEHGVPGRGWGIFHARDGSEVAVINAQGRTFMQPIENPFTSLDALLEHGAAELPPPRVVDFHCEITSEKNAFGLYLDGRVSAVVGTHTHVATADERILPKGTAYVSDIGMTGPVHSVIGFDPATVLPRFLNALPTRFEVGSGPVLFNAIQVDIEVATGRAVSISRLTRIVEV